MDAQDHVFILNRQDVLEGELNTGRLAPPIIEFDAEGNVVHSWGDPTLLAPRLHSCHVDKDNNIWIASAPSAWSRINTRTRSRMCCRWQEGVVILRGRSRAHLHFESAISSCSQASRIAEWDVYVSDGKGRRQRRIAVIDSSGRVLPNGSPMAWRRVCRAVARTV